MRVAYQLLLSCKKNKDAPVCLSIVSSVTSVDLQLELALIRKEKMSRSFTGSALRALAEKLRSEEEKNGDDLTQIELDESLMWNDRFLEL